MKEISDKGLDLYKTLELIHGTIDRLILDCDASQGFEKERMIIVNDELSRIILCRIITPSMIYQTAR